MIDVVNATSDSYFISYTRGDDVAPETINRLQTGVATGKRPWVLCIGDKYDQSVCQQITDSLGDSVVSYILDIGTRFNDQVLNDISRQTQLTIPEVISAFIAGEIAVSGDASVLEARSGTDTDVIHGILQIWKSWGLQKFTVASIREMTASTSSIQQVRQIYTQTKMPYIVDEIKRVESAGGFMVALWEHL